MSDLTSDACGAQNPLMRLADHVTRDQSFRQEGLHPSHAAGGAMAAPTSINMGALLQNIEGLRLEPSRVAPGVPASSAWSEEFTRSSVTFQPNAGPLSSAVMPGPALQSSHLFMHRSLGLDPVISRESWASDFLSQKDNVLDPSQLDRAALEAEDPALREAARQFVSDVTDEDLQGTSFMNYVRNLAGEEAVPDASFKDLQDLDNALQATRERTTFAYDDDVAFWKSLEDAYRNHFLSDLDAGSLAGFPNAANLNYRFAEANEHREDENAFAKGEAFLREGNIPEAVLCFEAAVQQKPDSAASWERLGLVLAENEQESDAIIACRKCLDIEPRNGSALLSLARSFTNEMLNRDACLSLQRWLASQERYRHLVPAEDLETNQLGRMNQFTTHFATTRSFVSQEEFSDIESKLLAAVQLGSGDIDPDLQIAMGILFNVSADFAKAVDCFETALKVRSDDALLWNKLGATLANSRRSELAVSAYRRALELAPGFVRARSNLSIACIEMGAYWEAIEHGLVALNLQAKSSRRERPVTSSGGAAESIWALLRMSVSRMDSGAAGPPGAGQGAAASLSRQELLGLVEKRDLKTLNEIFEIFS